MTQDWKRLARQVRHRRRELGIKQDELKAHGGPSVVTVRHIESADRTSYRRGTFHDIERALGWEPGSCEVILSGGDATLDTGTSDDSPSNGISPESITDIQSLARLLGTSPDSVIRKALQALLDSQR